MPGLRTSSIVMEPLWGPALALAAIAVLRLGPELAIPIAVGLLVASAIKAPRNRLVLILLGLATPYALGAYLGALQGIRFFPRPNLEGYWYTSREQLAGLLLAGGLCVMSGIAAGFQRAVVAAVDNIKENSRRQVYVFVQLVSAAVALHDFAIVIANPSALTGGGRHGLSDQFVAGWGPQGIVATLVLSASLAADAFVARTAPRRSVALFLAMWLPSVVAGDRNYFSVSAVMASVLYFRTHPNRTNGVTIALTLVAAVIGFTALPTLWSTNDRVWMNEWILPNSIYLPMALGVFSRDALGVTPLLQQWPMLLPQQLRAEPITNLATTFADMKVTGVAVGGNPWADLFVIGQEWQRVLAFAAGTTVILLIATLAAKLSPIAPLLTFGVMCFWGRSVFWGTVVIIVWGTIVSLPLYARPHFARRRVTGTSETADSRTLTAR